MANLNTSWKTTEILDFSILFTDDLEKQNRNHNKGILGSNITAQKFTT